VTARLSLDRLPASRPHARTHTHAGYVKEKNAQAETVQTKKADTHVLSPKSSQPCVLASASLCFSHLRCIPLASPTLLSHFDSLSRFLFLPCGRERYLTLYYRVQQYLYLATYPVSLCLLTGFQRESSCVLFWYSLSSTMLYIDPGAAPTVIRLV
jgi:hypothetical protein